MNTALKLIEEKLSKKKPLIHVGKTYLSLIEHFPIKPIESEDEHELALYIVTELIELSNDEVFKEEDQIQVDHYLKALGIMLHEYEKIEFPRGKVKGHEMLGYLMDLQGLKQVDLSKELGGQSIVSSILSGKRELNKKQIQKLAKRFHVSVELFFTD